MKKGKIGPMKVQDQWYNNAAFNDEAIKDDRYVQGIYLSFLILVIS